MEMTGGLAVRRGVAGVSVVESSGQMSPRCSDISMNSNDNIFFTILGGRDEAGLYGPELCKDPCAFLFGSPLCC